MNWRFVLVLAGSTCVIVVNAVAQEINFRDLARTGPPVIKRYSVDGIQAEGDQYVRKFGGVDDQRVEADSQSRRAAAAKYESEGKAGAGQWVCTFRCFTGGLTGEKKGPFTRRANGSNRTEAVSNFEREAKAFCRKLRGDTAFVSGTSMFSIDEQCE